MQRLARLLVVATVAVGTLIPAATSAIGATAPVWTIATTPNPGHRVFNAFVEGIAARTADDVWAVGTDSGTQEGSLAEHFDGAAWNALPTPRLAGRVAELHDVATVSATDVWAVGDSSLPDGTDHRTLAEHWNGSRWLVVTTPNLSTAFGSSNELTGIAAIGTDDIWASGWAITPGGDSIAMLFEHWNGRRWTIAPTPSPAGTFQFAVAISAVATNDVWAVGFEDGSPETTRTAHYDGSKWSLVESPNLHDGQPPDNKLENVTAVAANDVWAVGFESEIHGLNRQRPLIEHWNGTAWSVVPSVSPNSELFGVTAVGANDVWAVGESRNYDSGVQRSLTMQWKGSGWTVVASPNGYETTTPDDATSLPDGSVWAGGATEIRGQCCLRTLVLHTANG